MNSFAKGALLLALAAFIGECLEFYLNMILAKELGEHGMGMYMQLLPFIFFVVIISSLELPVSISKFTAEQKKEYHYSMLRHALAFVYKLTGMILIILLAVLPFLPVFNGYHPLVRYLLFILVPVVSFSSIARGYFMGVQQMDKIAISSFLRKAVQLLALFLVFQSMHFTESTALFIALAVLIGSEAVVFFYLFTQYVLQFRMMKKGKHTHMSEGEVRKNLMAVSVPTTALRIFNAVTNAFQPFLIKGALAVSGVGGVLATEQYGLLAGVAMSIGFFPAFLSHSLMIALLPNVSESFARQEGERLRSLLQQSMWITCLYGIPAVYLMYWFAEPLTHLFFKAPEASLYLQLLWPYFLFHFFIHPLQAYLIGLGLVKDAFYHSVWSHAVSFLMMYILGSMQNFQMTGIILGMNAGIILLFLLHYVTICRKIGLSLFLLSERRFT
ncbi:oligosaccharide flippase family protein [Bacillus mangrovi]|uniref:Oligosaccharide flippase family protein n=1 Tax=Metabacillus mangrovi TaxID=1491830 RepID=A0A7X2V3Y1_9BACI|nr:polysaccharide biosynthesis protein [Metabacillus mangrovi]MTH53157.1 oligosaccharide flippase family protein [Metabacillus mangrovi]